MQCSIEKCRALGSRVPTPTDAARVPAAGFWTNHWPDLRKRSKLSATARGFSKRTRQLYGRRLRRSTGIGAFPGVLHAKNHAFSTSEIQRCGACQNDYKIWAQPSVSRQAQPCRHALYAINPNTLPSSASQPSDGWASSTGKHSDCHQ